LCGTLSQVFADLRVQRVPWSRNRVIFARKGLHLPPLAGLSALLPSGLPASLGASCLPGQVVDGAPKSYCLLLDAKNPLISLQWQAWWEALS
jgi:ubiquinone biosynthesis protein Coq4